MNINKAVYLLFSSFKNKSTNLFFEAITFVHVFKYLPKPGFSWGGGGGIHIIQMANKFILNAAFSNQHFYMLFNIFSKSNKRY